jgi:hypothetical protein
MAIRQMKLLAALGRNKLEAALDLFEQDKRVGRMVLDASGLQEVINNLAKVRAKMSDRVPFNIDLGSRFSSIKHPAWRLQRYHDGTFALFLRHPGFGWLAFRLSGEEARQIGEGLMSRPGDKTE